MIQFLPTIRVTYFKTLLHVSIPLKLKIKFSVLVYVCVEFPTADLLGYSLLAVFVVFITNAQLQASEALAKVGNSISNYVLISQLQLGRVTVSCWIFVLFILNTLSVRVYLGFHFYCLC